MQIGVPRERLPGEGRVGLLPEAVHALTAAGHTVLVESGAGRWSCASDEDYRAAGAMLQADVRMVYECADLIVKVKEPLEDEVNYFHANQMLFCFLHVAAHPELLDGLHGRGCLPIAYEGIRTPEGEFPILTPMSRIAGRLAVQLGAVHLLQPNGGKGILLGNETGDAGHVVVLGCGTVGRAAVDAAVSLGARVTALDIKPSVLEVLRERWGARVELKLSTDPAIVDAVRSADLLIGAVLVPGEKAPQLIRREHVRLMEPGSVIVDVAIDQGGCCETSRPTTFDAPVFVDCGVLHCCVKNLPSAVARSASQALVAASLPYVKRIADLGRAGIQQDPIIDEALLAPRL